MKLILALLLLIHPVSTFAARATFTSKVWARADSTGKANGDRFTFLNDGTFIITSPCGRPTMGRWAREGGKLQIYENGSTLDVTIESLTANKLRMKVDRWGDILDLPFALVDPSEPDSIHFREFDPNAFQVRAGGYEPSWSFVVEGNRAVMRTPGETSIVEVEYKGTWARNPYNGWEFSAKATHGDDSAVLTIADGPNECAEEEARDYTMVAHLGQGPGAWDGCARLSRFLK